jgi:hypothetical protein
VPDLAQAGAQAQPAARRQGRSAETDSLGDARGGLGYSQIGHVRDVAKERAGVA